MAPSARLIARQGVSSETSRPPHVALARRADGGVVIQLSGVWRLRAGMPSPSEVLSELNREPAPAHIGFDTSRLAQWDSSLVNYLVRVLAPSRTRAVTLDWSGLPSGLRRLIALFDAVPERRGAAATTSTRPLLERLGRASLRARDGVVAAVAFLGDVTTSFGSFARGRAQYRIVDLLLLIQQAGAEALPIVTLIAFLVGAIFAFVGAVQLQKFGAGVYVGDLVGIAMVREMGAMMTAIVLAGRTGAPYAAQLGTMKVTQEIDALTTMGLPPMEFLVLPRMVALGLMTPLLTLYADVVGILGGDTVAIAMLGIPQVTYLHRVQASVDLTMLWGGALKATVYGVLVGFAGCLRGLQSGASASAVGDAATSAVVTSIVLVISACGLFAVLFYVLGI
jgi:phospholipid/cholesterol/gamma-HCH transport system permease protein